MKKTILIFILGIYLIGILSLASALTISSVDMNPNEITPGESSNIKIGIENEGDNDVTEVSISLDLTNVPFAPFDSSSEDSFDEIREGKIKYADFQIVALNDAKSGIYKIPLKITYRDSVDDTLKTKSSLIGVSVNSKPIISLNVEEGLFLKNQENKFTVRVTNKGSSDVQFLEVELLESTYYDIVGQKNIYIGNINSDDFDSAEFNILFKDNSLTRLNIPAIVRYRDNLNNEYEENINLEVSVYTKKQATDLGLIAKNNTGFYIGIVITLIVIFFLYRMIKKRRKLKKQDSLN